MKTKHSILAALAALSLLPVTASAAVMVDFSGGGGTPLFFTLPAISWQITDAVNFNGGSVFGIGIAVGQTPALQSVGTSIGGNPASWSASGASTFPSFNPQPFYPNNSFGGANNGGIIWCGMVSNFVAVNGETFTFSGGTMGNDVNVPQTFADGLYEVYLIDAYYAVDVSTAAVPEPSSLALALGAGLLAMRRQC